MRIRQLTALGERVRLYHMRIANRRDVRERRQRQAETERRVSGHEEELARACRPRRTDPAARVARGPRVPGLHGQNIAGRLAQAALEHAREPRTRHRVVELVRGRIEVLGELPLQTDEVPRVLVRAGDRARVDLESPRDTFEKIARRVGRNAIVLVLGSDQRAVGPDRAFVAAPEQRERPARQLLARIPLSLAVVQKPLRREARAQTLDELGCELALGRTDGPVFHSGASGSSAATKVGYIAGSYGPMILGQMGADVIKIESLEGDAFRHFGFGFLGWNQGKAFAEPESRTAFKVREPTSRPTARAMDDHLRGTTGPSPARRPDVGSRPIQPAPGRYASHHACRSVKSCAAPLGPSSDFTSATSWIR
jgi:hypothetical protein